jgi:hypothetical protein
LAIPIFFARTLERAKEHLGAVDFVLTDAQMAAIDKATAPAIASVMPESGSYPYPMLEFGTPALPNFYSRASTQGQTHGFDEIQSFNLPRFPKVSESNGRNSGLSAG